MADELILHLFGRRNEEDDDESSDEHDDHIENGYLDAEEESMNERISSEDSNESGMATSSSERNQVMYDVSLPIQHSYLGSDLNELSGRVMLDDEVQIPLLTLPGIVLVPGQILPLQLEHPSLVAMMKKIIDKERTFGLTSSSSSLGTTAEIRSFGEEEPNYGGGLTVLRIKAEGRQRFQIKETWRQPDGILMGKVIIKQEIDIASPLQSNPLLLPKGLKYNRKLLPVSTPFPIWVYEMYDPFILMDKIKEHLKNWASTAALTSVSNKTNDVQATEPVVPRTVRTTKETTEEAEGIRTTRTIRTIMRRDTEDEESEESSENTSEDENEDMQDTSSPQKPSEFSYWVAANLPLENSQRLDLLSLDCPIQRLRWELSVLEKYNYLCCSECKLKICNRNDIFSMSIQGPQGTYVNPSGYVHETLTVYKAESLSLMGRPSIEFSWFPGYAWTICRCSGCGHHMGWRFTAINKKLKPESFWGLTRSSLETGYTHSSGEEWKPVI